MTSETKFFIPEFKKISNFEFLIQFLDGTRQSLELQIEARRQQDTFNLQITPLTVLKWFFSIDISNWQTKKYSRHCPVIYRT